MNCIRTLAPAAILIAAGSASAADIINLGAGTIYDISDDGTVVFGGGGVWTEPTGWQYLGGPVFGGSADGTVAVGMVLKGRTNREAFRWTSATGTQWLGYLTGPTGGSGYSEAHGVSLDGQVSVGWSYSSTALEAFRTTSSGLVSLGDLAGGAFESNAEDASLDGSVIVGWGTSASGHEAMRWTAGTGMVGLGDLPGGQFYSAASGVSADGSVVVGFGSNASDIQAMRWTQATGMVALDQLGATYSYATGVSADGSIVVGSAYYAPTDTGVALVWTDGTVKTLFDLLVERGVGGLEGWTLGSITAISANGQWVGGNAYAPGEASGTTFLVNISAVPLPASVWMFGSGLAWLGWRSVRSHLGDSRRRAAQ